MKGSKNKNIKEGFKVGEIIFYQEIWMGMREVKMKKGKWKRYG